MALTSDSYADMRDLMERPCRLPGRFTVIKRRVAQGDMLHGLLGATVVLLYAQSVHGPAWDQRPEGGSSQ